MSQNLESVFTAFLESEKLQGQNLLLMVSGGVDSMVLLDVAAKSVNPENLSVLHINHGAREAAHENEQFVQNICSKYNIAYFTVLLDFYPGQNVEASWREARQEAATEAASEFGAERVLTAHHATDLVETMIFRLTKGAGPSGLSPFDTSTKPFWQVPKTDLLAYAKKHQIEWREDYSNLNKNFERNLIRADVLPPLRKITPNLEKVFVREAKTFDQVQIFLSQSLNDSCHEALSSQSISLADFTALSPILQTELLRSIASKTPSHSELSDTLKWLLSQPKGGTEKSLAGTKLRLKSGVLSW